MKQLFIATFLSITLVFYACTRNRVEGKKVIITSQNKGVVAPHGPKVITRNIIQDRKGDIWMAAFDGVFKYDGKSFANMTRQITPARFFSILEDRKGNFWFGSVGSGVYRYNGASFEIFTTKQGLLDNGAGSIYEDQNGHIWFGGSRGLSRYDGNSFHNYLLDGDSIYEAKSEKMKTKKHLYGVTTIMQDKIGIFWFGAGGVFRYDGKSFIPFKHDRESFKNVRSIIEDRKGHIWIGGADGLWYYDGRTVTNLTQRFVGYIMEDRRGNIWISSEKNSDEGWTLSYYDRKTLSRQAPTATTVVHSKMIFGILEDDQGHIWFGDFDGVHRYDGKNITNFNARAN